MQTNISELAVITRRPAVTVVHILVFAGAAVAEPGLQPLQTRRVSPSRFLRGSLNPSAGLCQATDPPRVSTGAACALRSH
jgi:hypothetical protein